MEQLKKNVSKVKIDNSKVSNKNLLKAENTMALKAENTMALKAENTMALKAENTMALKAYEIFNENNDNHIKFYKKLTSKIKKMNNGDGKKWYLHIYIHNYRLTPIEFKKQKIVDDQETGDKPEGLWTSGLYKDNLTNRTWANWVENDRNFGNPLSSEFYIVKIDESKILHISTLKQLNEFTKYYLYKHQNRFRSRNYTPYIQWDKVAENYDGIDISPYRFNALRSDANYDKMWYRGWDVSSQCIWNSRAIIDVKKVDVSDIIKDVYGKDT